MALSGDAQQGTLISSSGAVNSLNDQSEQISSRFWYDELGRLILSQNARQFICTDCPVAQQEIGAKAYSYTLYDEVGRIVQVGELLSTIEPTTYKNRSQIKYADHRSFVENTSNYRHQVTTTKYDRTDRSYNNFSASYLRNRVAYTTYQQNPNAQVQESHYSYDVHGNVKSMLQVIRGDGEELTKRIDYEYDLVSGKVNKVTYQKDNSDQFIHQYTYDGDNRIIAVATSTDDIIYTKEATYQYYAHGPLARINYGELNVETQDFAYTIQGWIKQVQGQVFAYALGYNNTDYTSIGANPNSLPTPIATGKGLYNGNIATMSSKTQVIDNNNPWVQQFTYDQLNRIKTSTTQGTNQYATSYSYDANGNIVNLTRKNNAGNNIDNLTYNYENKSSGYQRNTNRLRSVDDAVATTGQSDDIEDQQEDNYAYDATGNLIYDRSEEIAKIEWTVSGKVHKVIRAATSTKPNLEFTYDASGNRIAKKVIQPNGDYKTTFYVRDASGNVMAVYKTSGTTNLTLEEQHIYGSSRLGIFKKDKTRKATTRALGERRYELTDHLGNVRVVLSDYKKAESIVISATDYYPFGMVARTYTSPEEYRYGFNGKEKDDENFEGAYDFGARILDVRLGRWLAVDPKEKVYPGVSTYNYVLNIPTVMSDPDGQSGRITVIQDGTTRQVTLETTVWLVGKDAELAAKTVNFTNQVVQVKDVNGNVWDVQIKVNYQYSEDLNNKLKSKGMTSSKNITQILGAGKKVAEEFKEFGMKEGDNIVQVDNSIYDYGITGQSGIGVSTGVAMVDALNHEVGHQLGFVDRYREVIGPNGDAVPNSGTNDLNFGNDYMAGLFLYELPNGDVYTAPKTDFNSVHYVDLLDYALSNVQAGTTQTFAYGQNDNSTLSVDSAPQAMNSQEYQKKSSRASKRVK